AEPTTLEPAAAVEDAAAGEEVSGFVRLPIRCLSRPVARMHSSNRRTNEDLPDAPPPPFSPPAPPPPPPPPPAAPPPPPPPPFAVGRAVRTDIRADPRPPVRLVAAAATEALASFTVGTAVVVVAAAP